MTTVIVHGALGTAIGRRKWRFDLDSPIEAFRAIEANTGKLLAFLQKNLESEYRVIVDRDDLKAEAELELNRPMKTIHIVPVPKGAGNSGGWLALIGIVIIAAVLFIPTAGYSSGWAALAAGSALGTASSIGVTIGIALTLGGISSMLFGGVNGQREEAKKDQASYLFDGPVNTYRQGNPVPNGCGSMIVGSLVVSAGIRSVDIPLSYEPQ